MIRGWPIFGKIRETEKPKPKNELPRYQEGGPIFVVGDASIKHVYTAGVPSISYGGFAYNLSLCLRQIYPAPPKGEITEAIGDFEDDEQKPVKKEVSKEGPREDGIPIKIVSGAADDPFGRAVKNALENAGIDASEFRLLQPTKSTEVKTGIEVVKIDSNSSVIEHQIEHNSAFDHLLFQSHHPHQFNQGSLIYFGSISHRSVMISKFLRTVIHETRGVPKFVDLNIVEKSFEVEGPSLSNQEDHTLERAIKYCLQHATYVKANLTEAKWVINNIKLDVPEGVSPDSLKGEEPCIESFIKALCHTYENIRMTAVTLGARGSYAGGLKDEIVYEPGYELSSVIGTVVNNHGAGEAFSAGFIYGLGRDEPLARCLQIGNAYGALSASIDGSVPVLREREKDLENIMNAGPRRGMDAEGFHQQNQFPFVGYTPRAEDRDPNRDMPA